MTKKQRAQVAKLCAHLASASDEDVLYDQAWRWEQFPYAVNVAASDAYKAVYADWFLPAPSGDSPTWRCIYAEAAQRVEERTWP